MRCVVQQDNAVLRALVMRSENGDGDGEGDRSEGELRGWFVEE